jgi:hypothetical protein
MRVLIAARFTPDGPRPIGGVQSWSATVGAELRLRGHDVVFWGPGSSLAGMFDMGIAANIGDTRPALRLCTQHVVMCHGIIAPEKPAARAVAFTSEEVRDYWQGDGPIIRQPIDLDFWRPEPKRRFRLVRFSYRNGLDMVKSIADDLGLEYTHLHDATQVQCRDILNEAACVLATGRAALETMACGVPLVLVDDRPYQGPLMHIGSAEEWMKTNYSGRQGITPTVTNMIVEIEKSMMFGDLLKHVRRHHDAKEIVDQLLESVP